MKKINIDWQTLCLNLRKHRSLSKISKQDIGCDEATLQRLARGDALEPRFSVGVKLLNLHCDLEPPEKHRQLYLQNGRAV